jgi:hypothetical protein
MKASLQMRANVRKQWAKTVATHASKKAALQRAYDNPKTSAEYRVEMEQQVDLAKDVMDASEERLNDATKRFGRDYERFLKQKVSTFKEFMFVWAKIHSALANSVSCDLGILHSDISTKCPGGSYLDGGEFKSSEIKVVTAAEAKELFQAQLTAFTTAKEEEAAADKAAKEKLLAEIAAEAAKDLAAKEEAAAKRAEEEAAAKAAKEEEEATAAKAKEEEAAAAKAKEEEAAAALEADQAAEAEKTAAAALEAEQAAEAEKTVAATVEPEQAQAEPSATELFPGETRPSEAAV